MDKDGDWRPIHPSEILDGCLGPSRTHDPGRNGRVHRKEIADTTVIVKTARRYQCLLRLLASCRKFYPDVPIIVADDSGDGAWKDELQQESLSKCIDIPGVEWITLPEDTGLSACRNILVHAAQSEYILLADDDNVFTEETDISKLRDAIEHSGSPIAVSPIRFDGHTALNWGGNIHRGKNGFYFSNTQPDQVKTTRNGTRYFEIECGMNFFLAKKEWLVTHLWDDRFKINYEHLDFYVRLKEKHIKAVCVLDCIAGHLPHMSQDYSQVRSRKEPFRTIFFNKHNVTEMPNSAGYVVGVPDRHVIDDVPLEALGNLKKPNIVVMGCDHTGTRLVTRFAEQLGWNLNGADEEFAEYVPIRELNHKLLTRHEWSESEARELISNLKKPWCIKDPRFARTMWRWIRVFESLDEIPVLIYTTREYSEVYYSFLNSAWMTPDQIPRIEHNILQRSAQAAAAYSMWPGPKWHLRFEDIVRCAQLFDMKRATKYATAPVQATEMAEQRH